MKKNWKKWIAIIVIIWLTIGIIDFSRVLGFYEKPLFCVCFQTAQDGCSGRYYGLGYGFDIKGNFVTEDESRGVAQYVAYICGIEVSRNFMD